MAHHIIVTVFVKPEDRISDPDIESKVMAALIGLFPFDLSIEKINVQKETAEGFEGRKIIIYKIGLFKESHTTAFIRNLGSKLNQDQKDLLLRQAESRLDENLDYFIRLGKQELLHGDYYITGSGDCFHTRIGIAAFPKKRETALQVIGKFFLDK